MAQREEEERVCPLCGLRVPTSENVCCHCGNVFHKEDSGWEWKLTSKQKLKGKRKDVEDSEEVPP